MTLGHRANKLALQYALKLNSNPKNPAYDLVFNPHFVEFYKKKPNLIPLFALCIRDHLTECCPDLDHISKPQQPKVPPWTIKPPQINISLNMFNKGKENHIAIKTAFQELVEHYNNYTLIFTDGSKTDTADAVAAVCNNKII
jgi:hypothetical protein